MIDYGYGVSLGELRSSNLELYRQARNNPAIYKWCRQYSLISERDQARWFEAQNDDPKCHMFEVLSGDVVGVCGLTDIDLINRRAEFSLYIMPKYHGKGYSKPALQTLFTWGFKSLGLETIWGETFQGNHAAEIFKAMGMIFEGTRRNFYYKDGQFINADLFSILRSEWKH